SPVSVFSTPSVSVERTDWLSDKLPRDHPFLSVGLTIDCEGDSDAAEQQLCLVPPIVERIGPHVRQPARKLAIGRAHASVGSPHFVKCGNHIKNPLAYRY